MFIRIIVFFRIIHFLANLRKEDLRQNCSNPNQPFIEGYFGKSLFYPTRGAYRDLNPD